jgi:hypothetical protein
MKIQMVARAAGQAGSLEETELTPGAVAALSLLAEHLFLLLAQHYKVVVVEVKVMAAVVAVAAVVIGVGAVVPMPALVLLEVVVLVISTQLL